MSKREELAKALAVIGEVFSDNNAEDSSQGGQNLGLALLLSAMSNQNSSASSALSDAYRNVFNRTDEDVNITEVLRTMAPAWSVNMKNTVAAEYAKTLDFLTQNNQIAWNGITNANAQATNMITQLDTINSGLADQFVKTLGIGQRSFEQLIANPHYFAENAPATQDTAGEGDDTGDSGQEDQ